MPKKMSEYISISAKYATNIDGRCSNKQCQNMAQYVPCFSYSMDERYSNELCFNMPQCVSLKSINMHGRCSNE